jgi:hypothetical protein
MSDRNFETGQSDAASRAGAEESLRKRLENAMTYDERLDIANGDPRVLEALMQRVESRGPKK